jgi:hypothetical protein
VAILTALFSFLGKKAGDLFQAVLGWSVTALFGRLPSMKQTALSAVLVAALFWPILVIGVFVPAVASWMVAALPVHKWIGKDVIRIICVVLAVALPAGIGFAVHRIAPPTTRRRGWARMIIGGYPLTLGFAIAVIATALTVPIVKLLSAIKRWKDEHVYVQPMPNRYADAVAELTAAVTAAGLQPRVEDVPGVMTIGTRVLLWFARGTLDALVAEHPKRVMADAVELYLYPGDLLLRGEAHRVGRVRAKMANTKLIRTAYLVAEPAAQRLQEDLSRAWEAMDGARGAAHPQEPRLDETAYRLESADIPFTEWAILDREMLRIDHAMCHPRVDSTGRTAPDGTLNGHATDVPPHLRRSLEGRS